MYRTVIWLIVLLLVMTGVQFWNFSSDESSVNESEKNISSKELVPKFSDLDKDTILGGKISDRNFSSLSNDSDFWVLSNSPVLKDLTMGFDSRKSMHFFLQDAQFNGIKIIDQSDELLTIRFKVLDLSKASEFLDISGASTEPQFNYRLRSPDLPRADILEDEKKFGAGANEWLGASLERKDWGKGVKVAVLDSGVDRKSINLSPLSFSEIDLLGGIDSKKGHGTAVASIISGNHSGQIGLSPSASILSIRVLNENGEGDSFTVAKGIVEAVDRGANVINLSLGGSGRSTVLKNAVDYASANGAIVVAAVGNEGIGEVSYPAKFDSVIGVTSVDANGRQSSFANYGKEVDIAAPGVGVFSTWDDEGMVSFSGTSTAAAFVSGAIAAEISKNPNFQNNDVIDLIYRYANESEKPGVDEYTGRGTLNIGRIDNRNNPNIHDAAIVGYYFDPKFLQGGTTPFEVIVQNQGTATLNNLNLEVNYRGVVKTFFLSNLTPGQTRSEKLFLDSSSRGRDGVRISSNLFLNGAKDINPENNSRVSTISLPKL